MKHFSRVASLLLVLAPRAVEACASCMSSASGDQTYNWAYIGLMLAPFTIAVGIGGVLGRCYVKARRHAARKAMALHEEMT